MTILSRFIRFVIDHGTPCEEKSMPVFDTTKEFAMEIGESPSSVWYIITHDQVRSFAGSLSPGEFSEFSSMFQPDKQVEDEEGYRMTTTQTVNHGTTH